MSNILKNMSLSDKVKLFNLHDEGQYQWGAYVKVSSSEYVGMIVGKGGSNIIKPSMEYQTRVQNPAEHAEPCFIVKGTSLNGVIMMAKWICDKNDALLKHHTSKDTNIIEKRIRSCQKFVSLLVGPKGRTVKDIMNKSNTNIQSPPKSNKPKCFTVSGNRDSVDSAILCMQKYILMYGIAKESELVETCDECRVYGLRCASLKVIADPSHSTPVPRLVTSPRLTLNNRLPVMPQTPYLPHYDLIPYQSNTQNNSLKDYLDTINNILAPHSTAQHSRHSYSSLSPSSPSSSSSTEELHVRVLDEISRGKNHMSYKEPLRRGPEDQWKKWEEEHFEKMRQDIPSSYRNCKQIDPAITKGIEDLLNDTICEGPAKSDWGTLQSYWGC